MHRHASSPLFAIHPSAAPADLSAIRPNLNPYERLDIDHVTWQLTGVRLLVMTIGPTTL
jgi:hypothetical protein